MSAVVSSPTLATRFAKYWMPEPNSGCWLWLGAADRRNYARISSGAGARALLASHVSLFLHRGQHVPAGMYVCHHCDNPACVNPDHLFIGTPRDNALDMIRKGRYGGPPRVTRCKRGHEYTEENTLRISNGKRHCRTCSRERVLLAYHKDIVASRARQNEQKRKLKARLQCEGQEP